MSVAYNPPLSFFISHSCSCSNSFLQIPSVRPFSGCIEYLTDQCVQDYILPVVNHTFAFLEGLNDETLKKESSTEAKGDNISSIMKSLRHLTKRVTTEYDIMSLRLKMILRLLKIASFSGKMNALNEINKIIPGHS